MNGKKVNIWPVILLFAVIVCSYLCAFKYREI